MPGPRSAGACLHRNNEVRQPALCMKIIPGYFTRPPPDLTVRSQDTTRGSIEAHATMANIQVQTWMQRLYRQVKMVSRAPDTAMQMATALLAVIFSLRNTAARIKIKMVDIWLRMAAWEAVVYFMPATQRSRAI